MYNKSRILLLLFVFSLPSFSQEPQKDTLGSAPDNNTETALTNGSLYLFELLPHSVKAEKGTTKKSSRRVGLVTQSKTDPSLETRSFYYETFGKNILDLYTEVFDGYVRDRFLFDENLKYINGRDNKNLYDLKLKADQELGNFNTVLLKQLNLAFGLKATEVETETTYYELTAIEPLEGIITPIDSSTTAYSDQGVSHNRKGLEARMMGSAEMITRLIEGQFAFVRSEKYYNDPEKNNYHPVITNLEGDYKIDLNIKNTSKDLEEWIRAFGEKGLLLEKKKGKIPYIRIEKDL